MARMTQDEIVISRLRDAARIARAEGYASAYVDVEEWISVLDELLHLRELAQQRSAVLALHFSDEGDGDNTPCCHDCLVLWPCPTARALGVTS